MPMFAYVNNLFRNCFRKARIEQDLDDEIRSHLELMTDQKIKEGMNPQEAARAAKIELGGIEQVKEEVRAVWAGMWLETLWQDICFGGRMLRKIAQPYGGCSPRVGAWHRRKYGDLFSRQYTLAAFPPVPTT